MTLKCPKCGFTVFNRRFPKCESCGTPLGPDLAYSEQERRELFEQDRLAADVAWQQKQLDEKRRKEKEKGMEGDVLIGDV